MRAYDVVEDPVVTNWLTGQGGRQVAEFISFVSFRFVTTANLRLNLESPFGLLMPAHRRNDRVIFFFLDPLPNIRRNTCDRVS